MKSLYNLPEITFIATDAEAIVNEVTHEYEKQSGREIAQGDPVRQLLLAFANIIITQRNLNDETGKQNLLRYASGGNLDHIGAMVGVERLQPTAAVTTVTVLLSEERNQATMIPAGTRFTAGDNIFFALDKLMVIPAGKLEAQGKAVCLQTGEIGNGYTAGQIKTLVDPVPFVATVSNITTSEGGSDIESDDDFRERIHIAPESFSVAGPTGAYEYYAKSASADIADVAVISPKPGEVEIRPLLANGDIPGEELLKIVFDVVNDRTIRPLTDHVTVLAPSAVSYKLDVAYYIDSELQSYAKSIQETVEKAAEEYILWQKTKLGRDIIPSELIRRMMEAGARRVEVRSPAYTKVSRIEVAIAESVNVEFGGIEDE